MRIQSLTKLLPSSLALVLGVSEFAGAATLTVGLEGGADFTAIQPAIEAAADGDSIVVRAGEYVIDAPITFPRPMALTLKAESGPEATTIRMSDDPADPDFASVLLFDKGETENLVVEGFTITGGRGIRRALGERFFDRGGGGIVCMFQSSPTFIDCHVTGNSMDFDVGGGGVYCHDGSSPTFERCRFTNNQSLDWGGAVFCNHLSSPTFVDCLIAGNTSADHGGGVAIRDDSAPTFTNCRITSNRARQGGGVTAVVNAVTPRFERCVLSENSAAYRGGALQTNTSEILFEDCVFVANTADSLGGAVFSRFFPAPTLVRCTVVNNRAPTGGGMLAELRSAVSLTSSILWNNGGGALVATQGSAPVVNYSCIEGGWSGIGNIDQDPLFCWQDSEVLVASQSEFEAALSTYPASLAPDSPCLGAGEGGEDMGAQVEVCTEPERTGRTVHLSAGTYDVNGLRVPAGTSLEGTGAEATILQGTVAGLGTGSFLARVTVTGGTAGGIVVDSGEAPQIRECTIAGNSGTTGGGVYCGNNSSPSFTSCRILENAARAGAGVYCASRSAPTFVNSVISGNVATGGLSAAGGGIFCATNVSLTVLNCTLSANSAEAGGAITLKPRASAVVTNSILWNNQGGSIDPPLTAGMVASHSSIEGDHIWPGEGNTNQDPVFAGNDDFLLQAGSPAIDAGVLEGAPFTDIERRERPCGSGVDMGAYESDCAGPVPEARFIRGDCNADGSTAGVADATTLLSVNFAGAEPPPCLAACDANGDGTTSGVTDAIDLLLFNFSGGPAPPVPFPECGEGALPGDASLGCERPPKACL